MRISRMPEKNWESLESAYKEEENAVPIKIQNPKIEKLLEMILQRSQYSSTAEYLEARIKTDYDTVTKNKKLP